MLEEFLAQAERERGGFAVNIFMIVYLSINETRSQSATALKLGFLFLFCKKKRKESETLKRFFSMYLPNVFF